METTERKQLRISSDVDPNSVVIRFEDTGIGIDPAQGAQLFQPFFQARHTNSRHFGGTGLGLAISKRIVELMGGKIAGNG